MADNDRVLSNLIEAGFFTSRAEQFIDDFRQDRGETWFTRLKREQGAEAAEQRLVEWGKSYRTFSESLTTVAVGMAVLAHLHPQSVQDITSCQSRLSSTIDERYGEHHKFVAFNSPAPGCGCTQPDYNWIFGPGGSLPLRAIILETGYKYKHSGAITYAEMTLVFPAWGRGDSPRHAGDLVFIRIESTGWDTADLRQAYVTTKAGRKPFTDGEAFLKYLLGMEALNQKIDTSGLGSGIDTVLGFPGAEDYLLSVLPHLGLYLGDLGTKLSGTSHSH